MALPFSKSQIEKLGQRLLADGGPTEADYQMLEELLTCYGELLGAAVSRVVSELGIHATSRVKTTGTILEKLARHGGSWLKSIQDLAGMRIVQDLDYIGQDALVEDLAGIFASDPKPPKVIDRRETPSSGYTAVHLIVFPEGIPVEIQVRTKLQHEWAEMFEKLADYLGRGIRYGAPPDDLRSRYHLAETSPPELQEVFETAYGLRLAVLKGALIAGDYVNVYERGIATAALTPETAMHHRQRILEVLEFLKSQLPALRALDARVRKLP